MSIWPYYPWHFLREMCYIPGLGNAVGVAELMAVGPGHIVFGSISFLVGVQSGKGFSHSVKSLKYVGQGIGWMGRGVVLSIPLFGNLTIALLDACHEGFSDEITDYDHFPL